MKIVNYIIQPDGKTIAIAPKASRSSVRAASVYPTRIEWRVIFRLMRVVGLVELSRDLPAANWTADLRASGGPVVSGFFERARAIEFEVSWLLDNWGNCDE